MTSDKVGGYQEGPKGLVNALILTCRQIKTWLGQQSRNQMFALPEA
jgi:hypothetical protein